MEAAAATGLRPYTAPLGAARRAGAGGGVGWQCASGQRRLGRGTTNPAMDSGDVWGRSSSTSSSAAVAAARRLQSRYDLYMGFVDADAGGDKVEARGAEAYNCPFCGEDFDFVGLCCHIDDEHAVEAKCGVLFHHEKGNHELKRDLKDMYINTVMIASSCTASSTSRRKRPRHPFQNPRPRRLQPICCYKPPKTRPVPPWWKTRPRHLIPAS